MLANGELEKGEVSYPIDEFLDLLEEGLFMIGVFQLNLEHYNRTILDQTPWYYRWKSHYREARKITQESLAEHKRAFEKVQTRVRVSRSRGVREIILSPKDQKLLDGWKWHENILRRAIWFPPETSPYR